MSGPLSCPGAAGATGAAGAAGVAGAAGAAGTFLQGALRTRLQCSPMTGLYPEAAHGRTVEPASSGRLRPPRISLWGLPLVAEESPTFLTGAPSRLQFPGAAGGAGRGLALRGGDSVQDGAPA